MLKLSQLDRALRQEQMQENERNRIDPPRSVADIPDADLLRRVVRSIAHNRPRRKEFAWAAVSEAFCLGSTYSMQLCRRFGLDPDTGAELKTPNAEVQRLPAERNE